MNTITKTERAANDLAFKSVSAKDPEERQLLKAAKELRLVLPKYLGASKQTIRTIPN
jgi:hypothetical protein